MRMPSACVLLCPGNVIFKFTVRKQSCGKVMFSQACVKNSVHGGVCLSACWDTPPWRQTPSPGGRHPSLEADTHRWRQTPLDRHPPGQTPPLWRQTPHLGTHTPGGRPPPPPGRRLLQRTVRISPECILVVTGSSCFVTVYLC